ncbi:unnamed protein product [Somion occarium]|uniref:DNA replication regulator SLD2 n=1 Tax=Somion occarium TaxID=3059160 RepID=A0ABP1CHG9_9APHY
MDVATLRAEIKSWEREFKSQHGREPTIQEIKQLPAIAEKYKLYRKLSKNASSASSSSQVPLHPPSMPPKSKPRPSSSAILSKPRAVKTDGPPITSNPFSPAKKRIQHRDLSPTPSFSILPELTLSARANPFSTPRKNKDKSKLKPHAAKISRDPSPDPFPLIQPLMSTSMQPPPPPSSSSHSQPTSFVHLTPQDKSNGTSSAVTRARKRLRGEPVSPSPVKEKRARVITSQSTLNFVKGHVNGSRSSRLLLDEDSDLSDGPHGPGDDPIIEDASFIENTPMKPPVGGKAFIQLFEEAPARQNQDVIAARQRPIARSQSRVTKSIMNNGLSGSVADRNHRRNQSRALTPDSGDDEGESWAGGGKKIKALSLSVSASATTSANGRVSGVKPKVQKKRIPQALLPGKDDLWSAVGPSTAPKNNPPPELPKRTSGMKRTSSDIEMDGPENDNVPAISSTLASSKSRDKSKSGVQLPPSPPPTSKAGAQAKGKGKAKALQSVAAISRKKARLLKELGDSEDDDAENEDDSNEDANVKVVDWSWRHRHLSRDGSEPAPAGSDEDYDPTSRLLHPQASSTSFAPPVSTEVEGTCEINLPSDLQRVLALSPTHTNALVRDKAEEKVVKELLYGSREMHYDPKRGGIIWDVGEDDQSEGVEGGEDDWEGEPVPWEVGEL